MSNKRIVKSRLRMGQELIFYSVDVCAVSGCIYVCGLMAGQGILLPWLIFDIPFGSKYMCTCILVSGMYRSELGHGRVPGGAWGRCGCV